MGEPLVPDDGEPNRQLAVPATREGTAAGRSLDPKVVLTGGEVEHAIDSALDPAFSRKEQIREATESLHPVLIEALNHPLAVSALSTLTFSIEEFTKQADLLQSIDHLNQMVEAFMRFVENSKSHNAPNEAKRLMNYVTVEASLFSRGAMLRRILIAFEVLAKTKLREIAKRPSGEPFDPEEFQREQMIHQFMVDLCTGVNTQRF